MKNLAVILIAAAAPVLAGDVRAGQAVYMKSCKACHGAAGEGNAVLAKMIKATIPDLAAKEVQAKSDADLKSAITEGRGKMKPVKTIAGADLENTITFVRTLARK